MELFPLLADLKNLLGQKTSPLSREISGYGRQKETAVVMIRFDGTKTSKKSFSIAGFTYIIEISFVC